MAFIESGSGDGQQGAGLSQPSDGGAASFDATGTRPVASFSAYDPKGDMGADRNGPVLVLPSPSRPSRRKLWVQRIWLVVFVLFCLEIGIILTVLPWTRIWSDNSLLQGYPQLRDILMLGFVRGLVSGLGLIDIWMGVAEAVRYRESAGT